MVTWKDAFKIAVAFGVVLGVIYLISGGIAWLLQKRYEKTQQQMEFDISTREISCVTDSHYTVTLLNTGNKPITRDNLKFLEFYIDESKVVCEGIEKIEVGTSTTCKISQFTSKGSHYLKVSAPRSSEKRLVNCE